MTDQADEIAREIIQHSRFAQADVELQGQIAAALRPYASEIEAERDTSRATVDRVWQALGVVTYEQAGGKAINEIVADVMADRDRLAKEVAGLKNEVMLANVCANMHRDERDRLRGALERIASSQAFDCARSFDEHDTELIARMDFAESALSPPTPEGGGG